MKYMSILEISHRWVDEDPMTAPNSPISLKAQNPLRAISYAVASGEMYAYRPDIFFRNEGPGDASATVIFDLEVSSGLTEEEGLSLVRGDPDRELLQSLFVSQYGAFSWAVRNEFDFPDFIIPREYLVKQESSKPVENDQGIARRPAAEIASRAMVQGAARAIWHFLPNEPRTRVANHKVILELCGKNYTEDTRRNWVSEVAPAALSSKPGRRRKTEIPDAR